ncbi:unnamed protein product [Cuscuta europaea]|uniref:D-aminoacid aminotransferase-like PLP-dependent enzymes superfamily protein n=1 Tax=Cuscuta europaea TaxID=41803 RepID=A0A9P0ZHX1_CUSEU|nr:unnamed protein product [Cuscuta europaea]
MLNCCKLLFTNGVISTSAETPSVATLLEAHPGAYTTTRTHNNGSKLLFWERHLRRLSNSVSILLHSSPKLMFKVPTYAVSYSSMSMASPSWDSLIQSLVNDSMRKILPAVLTERENEEELAITSLVSGNLDDFRDLERLNEENISRMFDVYVHIGGYVPKIFGISENGAHLAVAGCGREVANAKYSGWVRQRKCLEKLRPPSVNELLLSNNGDKILEGCLTNFFVVCCKEEKGNTNCFEIQTAPLSDGVLPGVIRQVILDICSRNGIILREVAPSWSRRETWTEAFITNSLRVVQHVVTIRFPESMESLEEKTWNDVIWEEKKFEGTPGKITMLIQEEIMKLAELEGYPVALFNE